MIVLMLERSCVELYAFLSIMEFVEYSELSRVKDKILEG